jgi:hypothetical protein
LKHVLDDNPYLFDVTNKGIINEGAQSWQIKYCKIWDNQNLIRNFIPCYRKSDGVIGLYDLVEGKFYTNSGIGDFLKGESLKRIQTTSLGDYDSSKSKYKIPVKITGKNLFDINDFEIVKYTGQNNYYIKIDDEGVISFPHWYSIDSGWSISVSANPGETITFSWENVADVYVTNIYLYNTVV